MSPLFFLLVPLIFAEHQFHHLARQDLKYLDVAQRKLIAAWSLDLPEELHKAFMSYFKFIDCDLKTGDRQQFMERYIKHNEMPVIKDLYHGRVSCLHDCKREAYYIFYLFVNVELKNGKKIGFRMKQIEAAGQGFYFEEATVYGCDPKKPISDSFMNYKPVFIAQKLMNDLWKHRSQPTIVEKNFDQNFVFIGCPLPADSWNRFDGRTFIDQYMKTRRTKAKVYDAIEVEKDEKWQFAITWDDQTIQFQMNEQYGVLTLTEGREINCRT